MRRCFYLALLAIFLAHLPINLSAQGNSPLVVDQPRLSKTVFINWEPIEVIFTVRYLDGYEPDYDRIKSLSFAPLELERGEEENPRIVRQQKYQQENYFDVVYSLRMIAEKKGEIVLPAQKFFYIKLEPGKRREELEVKEFETKEVQLRYDRVTTTKADDIIDRIDFGDFSWRAYFWKGLALGGFALTVFFCWLVAFRYHPGWMRKKETKMVSAEKAEAVEKAVTLKESREKLTKILKAMEVSGEEFAKLRKNTAQRRQKEMDLSNALRMFLLARVPVLHSADTANEILKKITTLKRNFTIDLYNSLAIQLSVYEKRLYLEQPQSFWKSEDCLKQEIFDFKQELKDLNRPLIWWKELVYRWRAWRER